MTRSGEAKSDILHPVLARSQPPADCRRAAGAASQTEPHRSSSVAAGHSGRSDAPKSDLKYRQCKVRFALQFTPLSATQPSTVSRHTVCIRVTPVRFPTRSLVPPTLPPQWRDGSVGGVGNGWQGVVRASGGLVGRCQEPHTPGSGQLIII